MTPVFTYQLVRLAEGNLEREGLLVFWGADLLALLIHLCPNTHDGQRGSWFLAAGFGPCADANPPLFRNLEDAEPWFAEQTSNRSRWTSGEAEDRRPLNEAWTHPGKIFH